MKTKSLFWVALAALVLTALACGSSGGGSTGGGSTGGGAVSIPMPTSCESLDDRASTVLITLGETYSEEMHSSAGSYPGNCLYYCLGVPANLSSLDIGITGFENELNLYIGRGSIDVLNDNDVSGGSDWYSHTAQDGVDESVSIPSPVSDVYYIEVCSFDGRPSPFTLWTEGN